MRCSLENAWLLGACLCFASSCVKKTVPFSERTIVFIAKTIRTLDPQRPVAEAIAWRDGKIVAVGAKAEVLESVGANAAIEAFPTSTIVPGLVDVHAHLNALGRNLVIDAREEDLQYRLKIALEACARQGLTQIHDVAMSMAAFRQLQQWDMLGALPIRLYGMVDAHSDDAEEFLGLGPSIGRHLEVRTVHFSQTDGGFVERMSEFAARGFQVAVDATDAATVEHLSKLDPKLRPRIESAAGGGKFDGTGLLNVSFPNESSEFPIRSLNPILNLYAARMAGVSAEDALAGLTTRAAYASFAEHRRGVLKKGFDADFVVLPVDPVADVAQNLLQVEVQVTVVGGVDVYRAP